MQKNNIHYLLFFSGFGIVLISLFLFVNIRAQAQNGKFQHLMDELPAVVYMPLVAKNSGYQASLWTSSAHNDAESDAFRNWDNEDPPEIPISCAKCHSTPGYLDFLGMDGTPAWEVNHPAALGSTIECDACHNEAVTTMTSVAFNSGALLTGLGREASCMQCHQGRASILSVDAHIASLVGSDLDTVNGDLGFQDIHNQFVGDLLFGSWVQGGYEYEGQPYDARFDHVTGSDTCIDCHDPHSLQVELETCQSCHPEVTAIADLQEIRRHGSLVDYDGDGNTTETITAEIAGLQDRLYLAIQRYADEFTPQDIVYAADVSPYFYKDLNGNGLVDEGENTPENQYASWTGRLVRAGYNYHLASRAPGAYVHGAKYLIQLLYDSIADLNRVISIPVNLSTAHRDDSPHFAGSAIAWRNWDQAGLVPADCARCHATSGFSKYLQDLPLEAEPVSAGLNCGGCHNDLTTFTRFSVADVQFSNGALLTLGSSDTNLCLVCHQSRLSTADVDSAILGLDLDTVAVALSFQDPHNLLAGSTLFGAQAGGMYQYASQSYQEKLVHQANLQTCLDCHESHLLGVDLKECRKCHAGITTFRDIRESSSDYDGDGNTREGIALEVEAMHQALYTAVQSYASSQVGISVAYNPAGAPFFVVDTNANGVADPDEISPENAYQTWTPRLLRVAYNYQYIARDPGAFVHNPGYVIQVLYDSIADIGGDVSAMTRP